MRRGFAVEARSSRSIPLLIGTASVVPELGYAVPPGEWGLEIVLAPEGGGVVLASLRMSCE
ncbi:hypothetical protein ACXJJ3_06455 [Kribbella sp. WER1]